MEADPIQYSLDGNMGKPEMNVNLLASYEVYV